MDLTPDHSKIRATAEQKPGLYHILENLDKGEAAQWKSINEFLTQLPSLLGSDVPKHNFRLGAYLFLYGFSSADARKKALKVLRDKGLQPIPTRMRDMVNEADTPAIKILREKLTS